MKKLAPILAFLLVMPNVVFAGKLATVWHPIRLDKKVVTVGDPNAFEGGYKLYDSKLLGGKVFRPSSFSTTLASSLAEGGSESTLKVNSITLKDGTSLAEANYGSFLILTVGTGDSEEKIAVSSLATSTKAFTILSRGLEYGRWASSTANMKQHLPGERVFVSDDDHFLYQKFLDIETAETITGRKTFSISPIMPTPSSSDLTYGANVEYVNNVATSGAANASEIIKGIGEISTKAEAAAGTSLGGTGARLMLPASMATTTGGVATTSIPVTNGSGVIAPAFYQSNANTWSATNTFSGNIIDNKIIVQSVASTTISAGQAVYIATSTGAALISDANDSATYYQFSGMALNGATNGQTLYIQTGGIYTTTGLATGSDYFVSDTVGALASTQGTYIISVGKAISQTKLLVNSEKKHGTAVAYANNSTIFAYVDGIVVGSVYQSTGSYGATCQGNKNGIFVASNAYGGAANPSYASVSFPVKRGDTFSVNCTTGTTETLVNSFIPIN